MKNIFLCLTKANATLKTGGGDSQIFKHFWQYAACLLLAFVLGIGNVWATISTNNSAPSTTFTCGTTTAANSLTFDVVSSNSDTILFSPYQIYNSSVTWASAKSSWTSTSSSSYYKPCKLWQDATGSTDGNKQLTNLYGSNNVLKDNGGSALYLKVTNCTAFLYSGNRANGTLTFTAHNIADGEDTSKDISASHSSLSLGKNALTGLDATATYLITISCSTTSSANNIFAEIGFVYPHAGDDPDPVAVTGITISPSSPSVEVGSTVTLSATVAPNDATDKAVTWSVTSGGSYASVDASTGVVTGKAAGSAIVTATAHDGSGITQSVTVTVNPLGADLTVHTPGVYTKATDQGGWGRTMVKYTEASVEHEYEIIAMTKNNSLNYWFAGTKSSNTSDAHCLSTAGFTTSFAPANITGAWMKGTFSALGSNTSNSLNEFPGISSYCSAKITTAAATSVMIKVQGYDQISFYAKDANATASNNQHLVVKVDGVEQSMTLNTSYSVRRFTLDPSVVSVVEITGSSASGESHLVGFSLRLPVGYTLQYNKNGGSGTTMENTTGTGTVTLRTNTYTKDGCSFAGWATSQDNANAGTVAYADGATNYSLSADATLYAVWKLNAPVVSCENNVITMTEPAGATVYYTTDGETTPTSSSTAYNSSSKPEIAENTTFKAIAILANHVSSDVVTYNASYVAPSCTDVDAPTDLAEKTSARTTSAITFEWTAASNASSYDVKLWDNSSCTGDPIASGNVTTTSKEFTGLTEGTTYYCKVQSKGNGTTYCTAGGTTNAVSGTTATIPSHTVTTAVNHASYGSAEAVATSIKEGATTNVSATPNSGYRFVSWALSGDGAASAELSSTTTNPTTLTMGTNNVTVTATFELIPTYTVTLNPNNGTIENYDGWTLSAGKYTKTVAEGTELALLEFTRSGYQFMTWRVGAVDKTSPITVSADIELKAIWGTEEEVTIYSWESPSGTAIEEGGTATHYNADGPVAGNTRVNYSNTVSSTTYYTISLNGKSDWSTDYIKISLDEVIKTGDKVKLTAYYNNSNNKTIDAKMKTAAGTEVFAGSGCAKNSPTEYEYTVPTIVDADELLMTRTTTETNCFITKLVITGNRVVEVLDPAQEPTITTQPTGGTYAWNADATQTVVATVSDGGTLSYQWYKKGDTDTKVGTNSASYAPTGSGTYYVIITNTKTGYAKTTKKSNEVSVTINERPSYKVTYYDGAVKLGEETVLEGAKPTHAGDYDELPMATFQGWFNNADLDPEHAVASIGDEVITAAISYYSKWNKTYAQDVDLVQLVLDNAEGDAYKTYDYATFLSGKGYLLTQGSGHQNALDKSNAFDTGLKLKNSNDNKLQFNVQSGKILKLTVGKINGMSIAINGGAATAISSGTDATHLGVSYYYSANAQAVTIAETSTSYNMLKVIEFLDPITVTYDATTNGGSCATEYATFTGTALTLPEATKSGWQFDGWFTTANDDSETGELVGVAGGTYTPSANITLYARFTETTTLATLTDIKVNGTTVDGFAIDKYEYNIVLPYKTSVVPTVAYTKGYSGATVTMTPSTITSVFGDVTLHVVSQDESKSNDYVLHISEAPKDMLCLIQATHTGATTATVTGYIGGTPDKNTQGNSKLGSKGHYFGIQLTSGTFQAGDVVLLRTAAGADTNGDKVRIFKSNAASEDNVLVEGTTAMIYGDNYVTLPETSLNQLYLRRGTDDEAYNTGWNPYIAVFAVYRPFPNPLVGSMAINSIDVTINNAASPKTITGAMPSGTNFASLSVSSVAFLSNDPANTDGVLSGEWNALTSQYEGTYTVTDKDGDQTEYSVVLTEDVAVESVTISGETTVAAKSQITLTATVLPVGVENKNVTWTTSDASKATVDAYGVVTGKAAGNVTITATSVADNTISDTYAITVTPFVGTERVYWFTYAADAAANGVTNNSDVFGSAPTGDNSGSKEITLEEGWVVNTTKKAGAPSNTGTFVVPAGNIATLYVVAKGSGSNGRYVQLKQGDVVKYTSEEFGSADPSVLKIDNVSAGTYTIAYVGGISNVYLYAAELHSYPITSVVIEEGFTLRLNNSRTPNVTITPVKAGIASQIWSIVSQTGAADAELNTTTGVITAGTQEGTMTVKVTVTDIAGNEVESGNCVVNIVNVIDQQPVTGSVTWNWNELSMSAATITEGAPVLANYIEGDKWAMLKGTVGDKAYNTTANGSYEGKGTLSFTTTVPGLVTITARSWNNSPNLKIGDQAVINSLSGSTKVSKPVFVPAGEVVISASNANDGMRIMKIEFDADLTTDKIAGSFFEGYERTVDPQYYGTICLPKAGVMVGATLFQIAYMDYKEDGVTPYKVYYDQVEGGIMEAGMPYIFLAEESTVGVFYSGLTEEEANHYNGLHGTLENITSGMDAEGRYMLYNNKVLHSTNPASSLMANRAYIQIDEIPGYNNPSYAAPAPKYRRISTGFNGANTTTGMDQITNDQLPMTNKVIIDGRLFILRGEKMYDATGRLVK